MRLSPLALCLGMLLGSCAERMVGVQPGMGDLGNLNPALAESLSEAIAAVEAEEQSASRWLVLAETYDANNLVRDAARCYGRSIELEPKARSHYLLGLVQWHLGEVSLAEASWERALGLEPNYVPLHWRSGRMHMEAGRLEQALAAFGRALELAPGDSAASLGMARCQLSMGQVEGAARTLQGLLRDNKRHKRALSLMARVLERLGRSGEAERMARRELKAAQAPERDDWLAEVMTRRVGAQVVLEQALRLMGKGQNAQAIVLLERERSLTPDNLGLWNLLLRALVLEGNFELALARYGEAQFQLEEHHLLLVNQGRALLGLGRYRDAQQSFLRAVELAPGYGEGVAGLGEALLGRGDFEAAADAFLRATRLEQTSVRDWLLLGRTELKAKRFSEASEHLEVALKAYPLVADLWALAAECAIFAGQRQRAESCLQSLEKRSAQHVQLQPLRTLLAAMQSKSNQ